MRAGEPLLQEVILYGRQLTQDDLLDDNEKEKITRDMTQLLEHYDHLRNFIDEEQERFVISVIIYFQLLDSDLFLSLVDCKKAATQRGSDVIIRSTFFSWSKMIRIYPRIVIPTKSQPDIRRYSFYFEIRGQPSIQLLCRESNFQINSKMD